MLGFVGIIFSGQCSNILQENKREGQYGWNNTFLWLIFTMALRVQYYTNQIISHNSDQMLNEFKVYWKHIARNIWYNTPWSFFHNFGFCNILNL